MSTNLALDDRLIDEAVRIGKHKTKKDAVTAALQQYVKAHKRQGIKQLLGKIEYVGGFDHKALRRRRGA